MRPYSLDLRERIVTAYEQGEGSIRELAERFFVAPRTVERYLALRRTAGSLGVSPRRYGPARRLDAQAVRVLRQLLREKNDRTDREYARALAARLGVRVSARTINRTWKRLRVTRKKKTLHATERDTPENHRRRRAFRRRLGRHSPRRRVFVDEFGTHLGMTRRYARARRGARAHGAVPNNPDPNVTLVMGLRLRGVVAPLAFRGAMDGPTWDYYVEHVLAPTLRRGDVVVVDGLGAHRTRRSRAVLAARGIRYEILPGYSPDLSPVEEAGSKVKASVRGAAPRALPALHAALGRALATVTRADARGWFRHAGYLPRAHRRARARPAPHTPRRSAARVPLP